MEAIAAIVLLFVGIIPGLYLLVQYSILATVRNRIRESWSDINAAFTYRHELISRLIEITRDHDAIEREVLERITTLRDRCVTNNGSVNSQIQDEAQLVSGLQALLAGIEAYPELKAGMHFQTLHHELANTEDRIQTATRSYNDSVRNYRNKCQSFPSILVANIFGFQPVSLFENLPSRSS